MSYQLEVHPSDSEAYQLYVEQSWSKIKEADLLENLGISQFFLITQPGIKDLLLDKALPFLPEQLQNHPERVICIGDGERAKHINNLSNIYNNLIEQGIDRRSCILALGGGVVGDLTGFVASSILRGVSFIQLPTTLLAAVDSSVGGKVAVNVDRGKNMVGAFYQPRLVYFNLGSLETLPDEEWNCGLAEMAKHAILDSSGTLRADLSQNVAELRNYKSDLLAKAVRDSAAFKASVVARDEKEGGLRAILNLGHTTAHALESLSNYTQFSHGEAVSRGLATALILSRNVNGLSADRCDELLNFLEQIGLPLNSAGFGADELLEHMKYDKKSVQGVPRFVLLDKSGETGYGYEVSADSFRSAWQEQIERFG